MNELVLVGVGGAGGAIARYIVGSLLPSTVATTLTVNVAGSLGLGLIIGTNPSEPMVLALGTGFCGAFTTFSSFAVEVVSRFEDGDERMAVAYGLGMAVAAIAAVLVGGFVGTLLR